MYSKGRKIGINIAGKLKKKLGDSDEKEQQSTTAPSEPLGMKAGNPGQQMNKSSSQSNIQNDSSEGEVVDRDDIITLTHNVKRFSDGLARLKGVFGECTDSGDELRHRTHERLGEVLFTLKNILQSYPVLQSTELFSASGALISKVKSFDYIGTSTSLAEIHFSEAIDQLALVFSSSVSEYLMGDQDASFQEKSIKAKSCDGLLSSVYKGEEVTDGDNSAKEPVLTPECVDSVLCQLQAGVDVALQRAKVWSKYMKDITSYIERKAQLETDYSKNLGRLAQTMKPILTEEAFLPLQSVYCTVLQQDKDYASTCQATQTLLQTSKFVEPLTARRLEHDKERKSLKDSWLKEVKRMQDSVHSLRKAQSMYMTRQQEYEKAKDQANKMEADMLSQSSSSALSKVDKRRKMEEEAMHKAAEAETTYKACVAEANCRQQELEKTKSELLARIRDQIYQCDQVIKLVTIEYFHLLHTVATPIPIQYHTLSETTKQYECGIQFQEFVKRLPVSAGNTTNTEPFMFEPFYTTREIDNRKTSTQSTGSASSGQHSQEGSPNTSPRKDRYRAPVKAWSSGHVMGSDTDSGSSKSVDSSPSNSPHSTSHRKLVSSGSLDGLEEVDDTNQHNLLSLPGADGGELRGILKPHGKRRNTTFGVDFQEQVEQCRSAVPPIITQCLKEIERRGLEQEGIYRKSGVKSKVEGLCQRFEKDPDSVDLTEENHNVISNVLKLYLRQLPEPLLTFKSYASFIRIAKEHMVGVFDKEETVNQLADVISKLPYSNFKTTAIIMHHLHRIATNYNVNQMTASNLGIVLGPTLLRPLEGASSLAYLVDMPHQTRAVELLITNVKEIFGPETEYELIPGETPVEKMDGKPQKKPAPSPQGPSSPSSDSKDSTETKDKGSEKLQQQPKTDSVSVPEKPVEQLIQAAPDDGEFDQKTSDADFVLPGSAQCDKKGSPSVTISDDEDSGDVDIQSDDELPDTLLPDDSHPPNTKQARPTVSCIQDRGKASGIPAEISTINASRPSQKSGKPSPPQLLKLASQLLSPSSSRKMAVPTINIIDSSPVGDLTMKSGFPADSDKAKKPGALQPKSSSSNAQSLLKSVGPSIQSSIQSFMMATAKSFGSNGSGSKSSGKSDSNNSSQDTKSVISFPKSCSSPTLIRQSSGSPSNSPTESRQNSSSPTTMIPAPQSPVLPPQDKSSSPPVPPKPSTSPLSQPSPPSPTFSRPLQRTPPSPPVFIRRTTPPATQPTPPSPIFSRQRTTSQSDKSSSHPTFARTRTSSSPASPTLVKKSTPPSPTLSTKSLNRKSTPPSPSLVKGAASMRSLPSPTLSRRHAASEPAIMATALSPGLTRQTSVTCPNPSLSSSWSVRQNAWSDKSGPPRTGQSGEGKPSDALSVSGSSVRSRVSPTLSRQQAVQADEGDLKLPITPTPPRFSPSLMRHSMSVQSSLPTSYGLRKTTPSPTLSRKSLSLTDHTMGKTGRISPRPLSSPLLLRQKAITPPLTSFQSLRETAVIGDKLFSSRSEHLKGLTIAEKPEPNNQSNDSRQKGITEHDAVKSGFGEVDQIDRVHFSFSKRAVSDPSLGRASEDRDDIVSREFESSQMLDTDDTPYTGIDLADRPGVSNRSTESSKSDQSSLSFSSHSSASDSDISSAANSDMSPEFRKKLISLPRPPKVNLMSGTGFPDFSPILPRQKDFNIKKADSTPSLPSAAYPLSGNLSAMISPQTDAHRGTHDKTDCRFSSVPRKSRSFEFQSITDSLYTASDDDLWPAMSRSGALQARHGGRPAHASPSVMPPCPRPTQKDGETDAVTSSSGKYDQSDCSQQLCTPLNKSPQVLGSDTPKTMPPRKEGLLPPADMTLIQGSTALKVCSGSSLLTQPVKAMVLSPPLHPDTAIPLATVSDDASLESLTLASPTPVPPNSPVVAQKHMDSPKPVESLDKGPPTPKLATPLQTVTEIPQGTGRGLTIDTRPCKAVETDSSLSPMSSHIPMPKTPPSPRDTHIPIPKSPTLPSRMTSTPTPKTPPSTRSSALSKSQQSHKMLPPSKSPLLPKTPPPFTIPPPPRSPPPPMTATPPRSPLVAQPPATFPCKTTIKSSNSQPKPNIGTKSPLPTTQTPSTTPQTKAQQTSTSQAPPPKPLPIHSTQTPPPKPPHTCSIQTPPPTSQHSPKPTLTDTTQVPPSKPPQTDTTLVPFLTKQIPPTSHAMPSKPPNTGTTQSRPITTQISPTSQAVPSKPPNTGATQAPPLTTPALPTSHAAPPKYPQTGITQVLPITTETPPPKHSQMGSTQTPPNTIQSQPPKPQQTSRTQSPPPKPPQTLTSAPPLKTVLPDTPPSATVKCLPLVPAVKDVKIRTARTTVQTTKSASREPVKVVKGPSGIVMGKAAIMPGGRGAMHRAMTAGGVSGTTNGKHLPVPPTTKHPLKSSTCAGSADSECVGIASPTTGRKTPSLVSSTDKKPPMGSVSGPTTGRKTPTGIVTASGRKTPTGSTSGSSGRKTPTTPSSSSSKSEKTSCSTCGRRKTSMSKSVSDSSQTVTLTAYRRASTGNSGVISIGESVVAESAGPCMALEEGQKKDGQAHKGVGKSVVASTKKDCVI